MSNRVSYFYLDASLQIGVCQAFALVRKDVLFPGKPGCLIQDARIKDEEWLPIAGQFHWIVIMRDKHIRSRTGEREALMSSGVRAFVLSGAGNYTKWQTLELMVRRWGEIERIATEVPGPYICGVTQGGVRRLTS